MRREHSGFWWLAVALLAAMGVACSSSGGDDDDGGGNGGGNGGGDGGVTVLPVYEYQLSTNPLDDPIVVQVPMGVNLLLELGCPYGCPNLQGEYTVDTGDITIAGGSHLTVREVNQPVQLFGDVQVTVAETFDVPFESLPTSGRMEVLHLPVGGIGHVYLTVRPGGAGIELEWDQNNDGTLEGEAPLSWAEFGELLGSEAPEWQQMGAFGYEVMVNFMLELAEYGLGGLELISITGDVLPSVSPVTAPCDAFSDAGLSVPPPPPVIPDQGYETFTWYDDAASGDVNPGDSFGFKFDYCLVYFPGEDSVMLNGEIGLNSWTEVVSGGVLRRIGFEGTSPAGKPGGVVFDGFEIWEVWDADDAGPGTVAAAHLGARIDGRMTLVLFEPAN